MLEFLTLKQSLKNKFYPVLVLAGNDTWIKQRSLAVIRQSLDISDPQLDVITLENPSAVEDIVAAFTTHSFYSKQKLVIADGFTPAGKKLQQTKTRLSALAQTSDKSCCLVILADGDGKIFETDGIEFVNCNRLSQKDVVKWITTYVEKAGKTINNAAAGRLTEYCLCDMARINTETAKLCDFPSDSITAETVEMLVVKDTEFLVYDLGKAIADKNSFKALSMAKTLLRSDDARSLYTVLYNYYRRLYYIRTSKEPLEKMAQLLGVKTGALNFAKETALKYKPMELKNALSYFGKCDAKIKQFYNDEEAFTLLIMQLLCLAPTA